MDMVINILSDIGSALHLLLVCIVYALSAIVMLLQLAI